MVLRPTVILFVAIFVCLVYRTNGRRIHDDLDVAGSNKQEEWKKGDESDYHEIQYAEKGEKGDKGYKDEHGLV